MLAVPGGDPPSGTRGEYEENTKRIRTEYEENTWTPPKHVASRGLVDGLRVAFPGLRDAFPKPSWSWRPGDRVPPDGAPLQRWFPGRLGAPTAKFLLVPALLVPQGLNGVKPGRLAGRDVAEHNANRGGERERDKHDRRVEDEGHLQ